MSLAYKIGYFMDTSRLNYRVKGWRKIIGQGNEGHDNKGFRLKGALHLNYRELTLYKQTFDEGSSFN